MRVIVLLFSISALIVSAIWIFKSGFELEPILSGITGVIGILFLFMDSSKSTKRNNLILPQSLKQETSQNLSVNFSLNNPQPTLVEENPGISLVSSEEREEKIEMMKNKIKILFIDDDKNFNVVKILKESGWRNTKSVVDIKNLEIQMVKEADIFFVDINGVGKLLKLPNEGLDLALMLKQKYQQKRVVIYSANKTSNSFHDAWNICDFRLEKNALPYQFQALVEQYSIELSK